MPEKQGWSGSLGGDLCVGGRGEEEERHTKEERGSTHQEKRFERRKTCDDALLCRETENEAAGGQIKPDPS